MVEEMKFETYLYIDESGDIVEATKKPSRRIKARSVCLKVTADIPNEHFETPIFGVNIIVPVPVRKSGTGVQDWLTQPVEQVDDSEEEDEVECTDQYDVPF